MTIGHTGLFISFEGNDGSGKTTQIRLLADWFRMQSRTVLLLREPGGTPIGERIRDILLDNASKGMAPVAEMLLYAASRAQLVHSVIKPALAEGQVVICDRFVDSSYAYQAYGRELGLETVKRANEAALDGLMPHVTLFLSLDADTSMARRMASGTGADRLENESIAFHRRAHDGYQQLFRDSDGRICRISLTDGERQRSREAVAEEIRMHVQARMEKRSFKGGVHGDSNR